MGFIRPQDGGQDLFVHRSQLLDGGSLIVGAEVTFEPSWNAQKQKPIAIRVSGAIPRQTDIGRTGTVPGVSAPQVASLQFGQTLDPFVAAALPPGLPPGTQVIGL